MYLKCLMLCECPELVELQYLLKGDWIASLVHIRSCIFSFFFFFFSFYDFLLSVCSTGCFTRLAN